MDLTFYSSLLEDIKSRIRSAQTQATLAANAEMIALYWDIGRIIHGRQQEEGWGAGVTTRLAQDLHNELPEVKGFSERNLKFMVQFYKEYASSHVVPLIGKQPVSQLDPLITSIPWGHTILLMQRIKGMDTRQWYMQQIIQNGWSRDVLSLMIKSQLHLPCIF
jgi:predicted nuclease of restriction endonuclease-like (RecB) superfamily